MTTSQDDAGSAGRAAFDPFEASILDLHLALADGRITSAGLVRYHLGRTERLDRAGPCLNSIPVLNPAVLDEAAQSDERRRRGRSRGVLDGIPYTVKDSYRVAGLTVSAGSEAFRDLVARDDAFVVAQLRREGAVLLGRTNMPPMADGGMQRGVYGRSESPYNPAYLAAAFASGSSHGSAVATTANLCAFGLGGETVSSGRSPASNNALVAYTPSRGLISQRGIWPLFATRDVVVPHTRSVADLLVLLDPLMRADPDTRGDLWRDQRAVPLPSRPAGAPRAWRDLAHVASSGFAGKRVAVPRMYVGDGADAIETRPSVLALWRRAADRLRRLGAELVPADFPLVEAYEGGAPAGENLAALGVLPDGWMDLEFNDLLAHDWDDFLAGTGDPAFPGLADVDPDLIFPSPPGALPDRYEEVEDYENRYRATVQLIRSGLADPSRRPGFGAGLRALEALRERLLENWMDENGFDVVAFPANADIGPADSDVNPDSADIAWRNGVLFSHGNYAIRHLGVPTLTVPMGIMEDIGMPVGLTFAGRAYSDRALIEYGLAFERAGSLRVPPPLR